MPAFEWTAQTEEAAQLLADGRLSNTEIAEKVGCDRKTLYSWRQVEEFRARVTEIIAEFRLEVERRGIARREKRLARLNRDWDGLQALKEHRADDPEFQEFPPNVRGLMSKRVRTRGKGQDAITTTEFVVDRGLLKSFLDMEKQAAIETGQWTEKREISGKDGAPVVVKVLGPNISMDDL